MDLMVELSARYDGSSCVWVASLFFIIAQIGKLGYGGDFSAARLRYLPLFNKRVTQRNMINNSRRLPVNTPSVSK